MSWNEIADTFDISRQAVYRRLKGHIEAKKESEVHCKNNQKSLALDSVNHILLTTIAAVALVGCGESQQSSPSLEIQPAEPIAEVVNSEPPTSNTEKWEIKTSSGRIPEGWEPFAYDSNDEFDPFLLRRRTSDNWDSKQKWEIKTSSGKIPESWEPFGYDSNDEFDPFLLRRRTSGNWDDKQKWEIKTSSRKIPEGWEPFGYDSNDEQDPFLLRRRIN